MITSSAPRSEVFVECSYVLFEVAGSRNKGIHEYILTKIYKFLIHLLGVWMKKRKFEVCNAKTIRKLF